MSETDPDPFLDECPECGGTNLSTAAEINDAVWGDTATACHDCTSVFDARERFSGGFDSDVARELHSTAVDAVLDAVDGDSE